MKTTAGFKSQWMLWFVLCGLVLALHGCAGQPKDIEQTVPEFDLAAARAEIEAVNQQFMEYFATGDSVGIASLYTADAKLMFAGKPADVGRAAIQSTFSGIINSGVTKIELKTTEVFGNEELLAEEGEVTIFVGDMVVGVEKYLILWKKEDGRWRLFRDIANSNQS